MDLEKMLDKKKTTRPYYLFFCFALPVFLMYALYILRDIYPFGDGSVLVLDMNGQYVYFFEGLRNSITEGEGFLYSFYRSLGGEFLGLYAYYLASPLSYIVLLFPRHRILDAILTIILIKVGLSGSAFGFYLHKHQSDKKPLAIIAFSALYALSAYAIVYQSNTMWIDGLIWLPILIYALEELIKKKKFILYVIALSLTIMSNYYIGYMTCIYATLYFFYYCFSNEYKDINLLNEDRHIVKSFFRFATYSLLSAAISSFVLLASVHSLSLGKSDFASHNASKIFNFNILEILSKLLPSSYDSVRPIGLPLIYCGVIVLILVPLYFISKRISFREKIISASFIGIITFSLFFGPFDIIWHGFQKPQWLNHRYSFMLSFLLLVISYKSFVRLKDIRIKSIIMCSIVILMGTAFLSFCELDTYTTSDSKLLPVATILLTILMVLVLSILLVFFKTAKTKRFTLWASLALVIVTSVELFCNGAALMHQYDIDVLYSKYSGYTDFLSELRPITEELKDYDSGFYRAEKTTHRKFNDNMALGLSGISHASSTLHKDSLKLLSDLGYFSKAHRSQYKGGNPVGDSLLGIKYIIDKNDSLTVSKLYKPVIVTEKYTVYQNPYAMSLAYETSNKIYSLDLEEYDTPFERLNATSSAIIGKDSKIFKPVTDYSRLGSNCITSKNDSSFIYSAKNSEKESSVKFTFTAEYDGEYYFYPMCKYNYEVKLRFNEKYYGTYLGSKNDNIVFLGNYNSGDTVTVEIILKDHSLYLLNGYYPIWYFNEGEFKAAFDNLSASSQLEINQDFSPHHLWGDITTDKEDRTILTTLPFDSGWKVYVDGEIVKTEKCMDALVSFKIGEIGKHSVELRYWPTVYTAGIIISLIGLITFAALIIYTRKKETIYTNYKKDVLWDEEIPLPENSEIKDDKNIDGGI